MRALAHAYGLPNWDKPAAPCLATRIPYGQRVTVEKLRQPEAAERVLRDLGFRESRVRHPRWTLPDAPRDRPASDRTGAGGASRSKRRRGATRSGAPDG